jgi:hypothetical protein
VLGVLSVSFVIVTSESAIDPAYSETDVTEGESEVMDRVPESSRTKNCEIEGFSPGEGEIERFGAESPLSGLEGRPCCARISCSTLRSVLYLAVPNLALFARAGICGKAELPPPPSSASSLISSRRVVDSAGEAVCSGKEEAKEVSLSSSACEISRIVS